MKHSILPVISALVCLILASPVAYAAGRVKVRGAKENPEGGITAGAASAYRGPNGATGIRAHVLTTDGAGNGKFVSGAKGVTANGSSYGRAGSTSFGANGAFNHQSGGYVLGAGGGYAARKGSTVRNSDGSLAHNASASGSNANGAFDTSGQFNRNADGSYAGARSTTASGANGSYSGTTQYANGSGNHATDYTAKNGDTYTGDTSWTKGQGVSHTGTCKDAAGNVITCPR